MLLSLALALVVSGAVVGGRTILGAGSTERPPRPPTPAATSRPGTPSATPAPPTVAGAPVLIRNGRGPLLPGVGSGQVYAESATAIFRIELATGRISPNAADW